MPTTGGGELFDRRNKCQCLSPCKAKLVFLLLLTFYGGLSCKCFVGITWNRMFFLNLFQTWPVLRSGLKR